MIELSRVYWSTVSANIHIYFKFVKLLIAYYRPLINFTFDENLDCSGCNALAFWRTGTHINVPDRITKVLYLKQLYNVGEPGSEIRAEGCLK